MSGWTSWRGGMGLRGWVGGEAEGVGGRAGVAVIL